MWRRKSFLWPAFGVFGFALIVRLVHLWQIRAAPFFALKLGDAKSYDVWARELAAGDWLGTEVFYQAPLYPYFLGVIYTTLGHDPLLVRALQAIMAAVSCVLLAMAGRRFFSASAGIAAGLTLALYAPAMFFDALVQKSVLDLFFLCLSLWLLGRLVQRPHGLAWWWLGMAMAGLILTRENALVFVAAILVWLWLHHRSHNRRRFVFAALFLLAVATVLLPVAVRNWIVGGEFHLTTSQFGPNFYIGNNEHADGSYAPLQFGRGDAKYERQDARDLAEKAAGTKLTAAQISWYWTRRALDDILAQPGRWLRLMAHKFFLLWNVTEIDDSEELSVHAAWSLLLHLTSYVFHFGALVPLALFGVLVTWHRRRELWLLYLMVVIYASSVVMFYIFGRYRYPLVPVLILFAVAGLTDARRFLGVCSSLRVAAYIGAAIVATVFCNWSTPFNNASAAVTYFNMAIGFDTQSRHDEAIEFYRRALEINPAFAEAHYYLGLTLQVQGRDQAAIHQFYQALGVKPDYAEVHGSLGVVHASRGRAGEAIQHLRQALVLRPDHAKSHYNLGLVLASRGKMAEAIKYFRRALEAKPDFAEAHNNLGAALQAVGQLDEAINHFRRAIQITSDHASAHNNLGNTLRMQGKVKEAISHLKWAVELRDEDPSAHHNMGVALAMTGRFGKALKHFQQAQRLAPDWLAPSMRMAWIFATHPDPQLRDSEGAIRLAEHAAELTNHQQPLVLDTLAAAYAAAERFDEAVTTARQALNLAGALGSKVTGQFRRRLELYQQRKPYHEALIRSDVFNDQ